MIIEIKGVEFENKGAHLMLLAIIDQVRRRWPMVQFALTHSSKASFADRSVVAKFRKLNFRKNKIDINALTYSIPSILRGWLQRKCLVVEADIDMIIDASGFSYSDQWPSKLRIYHLKNELKRFHRHGKPYMFMPQAFGPFINRTSRKRIGQSFKHAAMVCARDGRSYQYIEEITGPISNLFEYGDFTDLIQGFVPDSFDIGKKWACIVPNKNMVNVRNSNNVWLERYEPLLSEAIIYYQEKGLTPFFLNHEGEEDDELINRVNAALGSPIPVVRESNPLAVKGIIGASRAVLCSRYHGCVSAMSQGVACIGTSWSHKYELLYEEYQAGDLLLQSSSSSEQLREVIDLSLKTDSQLSNNIASRASELKIQSAAMWDDFQAVADRYSKFERR
jgi:polysaccharide pyruvyl transferase WcaK-like protein